MAGQSRNGNKHGIKWPNLIGKKRDHVRSSEPATAFFQTPELVRGDSLVMYVEMAFLRALPFKLGVTFGMWAFLWDRVYVIQVTIADPRRVECISTYRAQQLRALRRFKLYIVVQCGTK
jgi:hypothetical protein